MSCDGGSTAAGRLHPQCDMLRIQTWYFKRKCLRNHNLCNLRGSAGNSTYPTATRSKVAGPSSTYAAAKTVSAEQTPGAMPWGPAALQVPQKSPPLDVAVLMICSKAAKQHEITFVTECLTLQVCVTVPCSLSMVIGYDAHLSPRPQRGRSPAVWAPRPASQLSA